MPSFLPQHAKLSNSASYSRSSKQIPTLSDWNNHNHMELLQWGNWSVQQNISVLDYMEGMDSVRNKYKMTNHNLDLSMLLK